MASFSRGRASFARTPLALGLVLLGQACGGEPEVQTQIRVGDKVEVSTHPWANAPDPEAPDPEIEAAKQVLTALQSDWQQRWRTDEAPTETSRPLPQDNVTEPPSTPEEFEELLAQLRDGPIDEVGMPAHNLRQSSPELWEPLREVLLGKRQGSKTEFKRILSLFGGDVPNRYGHFALRWKKNHGYNVKVSDDWFKDLLGLPLGKVSGMLHPVYRDAVLTVAALHGAAHIGRSDPQRTGEVVEALLDAAYMLGGTFRDEVGRAIQSIGEEAVPHLVLASAEPSKGRPDSPDHLRARYARYNLDQLDRLAPSRALKAASSEPRRLIALLDAYGSTKPGDAAVHLLDWVNDPSPAVRAAARSAFEAYVTGPPPRMRVKSVRRLGGKTVRRQAYLSYRALAANAIWNELEQKAPTLLEEACETRREDGSYDQRCIEQPARHAQAWFERLDEQRRSKQGRELEQALARAESQLLPAADQLSLMLRDGSLSPKHEQALDVAEVLLRAADAEDEPSARGGRLRSAAALLAPTQPARARRLLASAFREESRVDGLSSRGREMLLAEATALEPNAPQSSSDTTGEASEASQAPAPSRRWALGLLYLLIGFACVTWIGARRARRRVVVSG